MELEAKAWEYLGHSLPMSEYSGSGYDNQKREAKRLAALLREVERQARLEEADAISATLVEEKEHSNTNYMLGLNRAMDVIEKRLAQLRQPGP